MADLDKKLETELARLNAEFDKRIAAVLDISNDAALEVSERDRDPRRGVVGRVVRRPGFTTARLFFFNVLGALLTRQRSRR